MAMGKRMWVKALVAGMLAMPLVMHSAPAEARTRRARKATGIAWAKSHAAAVQQAKANRRIIMVDFYTEWCGWCKELDKRTYTDPAVIKLSRQMVSLKLDAENAGAKLAEQFKIDGYPTIIFMDASGREVHRVSGFREGPDFANEMKTALKNAAKKSDDKEGVRHA